MRSKHFWWWVIVITILAFAVRASVLWASVPVELRGGDEPEYAALGKAMLAEKSFVTSDFVQVVFQGGKPGEATAFRSPVLPFFIAGHYAIFGENNVFPGISLILLASIVCVFLAVSGRMIANSAAGLTAAAIWAFYPPSVWSPYGADKFYPEGLSIFFLTGAVAFLLAGWRQYRWWKIAVAGALLGLAVLTRGYLVFTLPFLAVYLLLLLPARRWQAVAVFTVVTSLFVGGWIVRNQIVIGRSTLSTQTDAFYFGNNAWARGSFNGDIHRLGWESPQTKPIKEKYPNVAEMSEVERSEMWAREGRTAIVENPAHFLWLMPRKLAIFFGPFQFWSVPWYQYHYIWMLLFPLGIFFLLEKTDRQNKRQRWLLAVPFIAVAPGVILTFGFDRYRFPVEPLFIVLGAAGVISLAQRAIAVRSLRQKTAQPLD